MRKSDLAFSILLSLTATLIPVEADTGTQTGLRADRQSANERILAASKEAVGKKMWFGYGLPSGKLGCAAALCNVLKNAGYPNAKSAAVVVLRKQLLSSPLAVSETAVKHSSEYGVDTRALESMARPGDLIFGYMATPDKPNSGADAHCGIVAGGGDVYANDWTDGIWKRAVADKFFAWYPHIYIMRISGKSKP